MNKQFFILIGRSGSGKGTQAQMLKEYLTRMGSAHVSHFTTGGHFRDLVAQEGYVSSVARKINDTGGLQPEFLAVWNWASIFIKELKGGETIILDGAPRKLFEIEALHSAIRFMEYTTPTVIYLDVSEGWALDKLKSRGRADDTNKEEMDRKMEWFAEDVMPVLAHYKDDPRYKYIHVNGEQTIEQVHKELVEKLNHTK